MGSSTSRLALDMVPISGTWVAVAGRIAGAVFAVVLTVVFWYLLQQPAAPNHEPDKHHLPTVEKL